MVDKTHEGICDLKGKYSGNCQNISNPDREITTGIKYRRRIYGATPAAVLQSLVNYTAPSSDLYIRN